MPNLYAAQILRDVYCMMLVPACGDDIAFCQRCASSYDFFIGLLSFLYFRSRSERDQLVYFLCLYLTVRTHTLGLILFSQYHTEESLSSK